MGDLSPKSLRVLRIGMIKEPMFDFRMGGGSYNGSYEHGRVVVPKRWARSAWGARTEVDAGIRQRGRRFGVD
jgi:hypothetical protein